MNHNPVPVFVGRRLVATVAPASQRAWEIARLAEQACEATTRLEEGAPVLCSCHEPLQGSRTLCDYRSHRPQRSWKEHRKSQIRRLGVA